MKLKNLLLLAFLSYLIASTLSVRKAPTQQLPNILWIITDDHRADALECFNRATINQSNSKLGYVQSPNANQLASEGTLFVNAYCNSPACAPSRASMLTGQYPHRHGVYGFEMAHNQSSTCKPIVSEILREQGYQTSLFGKAGFRKLTWNGQRPTWDRPDFEDLYVRNKDDLQLTGFTDYVKRNNWREKKIYEEFYDEEGLVAKILTTDMDEANRKLQQKMEKKYDILRAYTRSQDQLIIGGVSSRPVDKTVDGYLVQEFTKYFDHENQPYQTFSGRTVNGAKGNQPQFVQLNFHLPHTPVLPPQKFRDQFKNKVYAVPEFDKTKEHQNLPPQLKKAYQSFKIDGLTPEEKQQAIQDYYAFCAYGDYLIGKAVQRFKTYCAKNDQPYLIIFTVGDHGWHLGEQGMEAKFVPYNTSNQGAVIVVSSDDRFPKGKVVKDFTEYVDFSPTILSAAQVDISAKKYEYLDGMNLQDIVNEDTISRAYVLGEMNQVFGPRAYLRGKDFAFSMRVRKHNQRPGKKFPPNVDVKWAVTAPLEAVEVALYDLRNDPHETRNVALDKSYLELTEWFRKKLGNIVLGDGRVEVDWKQKDVFAISNFAKGADDKKLEIPLSIIPEI
ncbi:MAG: sulfatase-like hydrolase/transferase [Bacteroidota bacterium]